MNWRKPSDWTGLALSLWFLVHPKPYLLAFFACAVAPLVATAWAMIRRNVALTGSKNFSADIELSLFWLLPSMALMLRGVLDSNLIDWKMALILGLAIGGALAALMLRVDRLGDRSLPSSIGVVLVMFAWGWGVISLSDSRLDRSQGVTAVANVVGRSVSDHLSTVSLQILSPVQRRIDIALPARIVRCVPVGTPVRLRIGNGFFGWRHVDLDREDPFSKRAGLKL